jgi:hypothetical protein
MFKVNFICKITIIALLFFLLSCARSMPVSGSGHQDLLAQWGSENEKQTLALGERIFDKNFDHVFTSCVTGMASAGLSVKNMERQSGYILAEGPDPVPLEKRIVLTQEMVDALNRVSSGLSWSPSHGNSTLAVTLTLLKLKKNQTKVKMRISTVDLKSNAKNRYYSVYPPLYAEFYIRLWRVIEKQLFMDEHLDRTE